MKTAVKTKRVLKNPDSAAMNLTHNSYQEVLKFIYRHDTDKKIDINEKISKADVQRSISNYLTGMKEDADKFSIVEQQLKNGNVKKIRAYQVKDDLLELFKFIKKESSNRGESIEIPTQLMHTDIMKYLKYCIQPKTK